MRLPKTTSEYDGDWLRKFNELQNDAQHNGGYLVEVEPIADISARLVVNQASYKRKRAQLQPIFELLK